MQSAEPFERLERYFTHRARVVRWAFVIIIAAIVIVSVYWPPPATGEPPSFALRIVILAAMIAFAVLLDNNTKRFIRGLRLLKTRLVDAGLPIGRGVMLVLNDGMVVSFVYNFVLCTTFHTAAGDVLNPSLKDAINWTRPRLMKRAGIIRPNSGPTTISAELRALQSRIGSTASFCLVSRQRIPTKDSDTPFWMVTASFSRVFTPFRPDRVAMELAGIGALLRQTLGFVMSTADVSFVG